ncbi:hypothetical protein [Actinoplanes solisilvae]|uniref:hypothetical protein n=1 Tax=Actinoplanes solisilvae TaxID=2486853 RepID=UPI000FD84B1F|nr:hypothetical protein [Actinoplanes solisilvae]
MSFVVPESCTLPTVEQPLRLAEFDRLFATAVDQIESLSPTRARMLLSGPAGLAATVRDLTGRETDCCSFFTFTISSRPQTLVLDIRVPAEYADVLASLIDRARA